MFEKKLRTNENKDNSTTKDLRRQAITERFEEEFPELLEIDWKKTLFRAQKVYDITF